MNLGKTCTGYIFKKSNEIIKEGNVGILVIVERLIIFFDVKK